MSPRPMTLLCASNNCNPISEKARAFTRMRPGNPSSCPTFALEQRFPRFAPAAVTAGLGAVFTFPLHDGDDRLGALDLYRDAPLENSTWTTWTPRRRWPTWWRPTF